MNRVDIATLSLRLAGIYVGVQSFVLLTGLTAFLGLPHDEGFGIASWVGMAMSALLLALLAAFLFLGARRIAQWMFEDDAPLDFESRPEISGLALRLAGILFWDRAIHGFWNVVFYRRAVDSGLGWSPFTAALASTFALALAGTWLFLGGPAIARRLFGGRAGADVAVIAENVQAVAFSIVGLWLLAGSVPELFAMAARVLDAARAEEGRGLFAASLDSHASESLKDLTRVALGLALFLGGNGLSGTWRWIQRAGHSVQNAGLEPGNKQA